MLQVYSAALIAIFSRLELLLKRFMVTHFPYLAARCRLQCLKVHFIRVFMCKLIPFFSGLLSLLVIGADYCRERGKVLD
jgi:hypothetical protein